MGDEYDLLVIDGRLEVRRDRRIVPGLPDLRRAIKPPTALERTEVVRYDQALRVSGIKIQPQTNISPAFSLGVAETEFNS
jgi:hypothetical protein